jgi:diguanylate cyclase (GGDEF)-like protein
LVLGIHASMRHIWSAGIFAAILSLTLVIPSFAEANTFPHAIASTPGDVLAGLADLSFEVMRTKQGLPHDSVYGFAQDSRGFLWIATFGGLSRYDGYQLRNYVHDEANPSSLPDNNIRMLLPAPNGGLWIATGNAGVITYDPASDTFHHLPNLPAQLQSSHVFCMADDGDGGLWFGSQLGLVHYQAKSRSYELFGKAAHKADANGFTEGSVFSILQDREGNLWVGGDHGLLIRQAGATDFKEVTGLTGHGQLGAYPPVWTIFEDNEDRLWIGTDKVGAGTLNRTTGHIEAVPELTGSGSPIGAATVRGIVEIRKDQFWIATYGSGLVTYNVATGRVRRYLRDLTSATPLSNDFLRSIYMDRSGIVWLGTDRGLSRVNPFADGLLNIHASPLRKDGLQGNEVRSVTAQGNRIWVGFDQGGFAVVEPDGRIRNVKAAAGVNPADQSRREVLAMMVADENTVYAGGAGLYEIDARRLTYRPVPDPLLTKQVINALLIDGSDVWAATYNGLVRYNRTTHKAQLYAHEVGHPGSLSDNYVRDLLKDSQGRLWITTRLGLDQFDPASGNFIHIRHNALDPSSLPNNNIQPIAEDQRGRLWIGTIGDGLTVLWNWTPDGKPHFRSLTRSNGFPSGIVLTVMRGKDGRIWCNTPDGLAVVDPDTLKVHTYTAADGLRTSSQNLFSSATLYDGTIVFPGDEGLVVVRPDLLRRRPQDQQLEATEISVPGDSLSPAALAWSSLKNGIVLPSSHRAFQASFALLDFSATDGVQYSYKLDGFDKDWISSPTFRRTAAYTNLYAGRYRLLIRASGRFDGGLSAHMEIPVVALAAWYESTWFLLLKIIAGILVIFLVVRLRTAVIRRRQAELETEVAMRTAELAGKQEELLEANEKLAELASRDPLTGIFNRRQFLALAEDAIDHVRRTGEAFTLLLIDADHFKSINDRYGHLAGDEILKSLVGRLSSQLRKTDLLARYGGEELIVLLTNTELHDGLELAERLRAHVANSTIRFGKHDIQVTISIGVTEATGQESVVELVKKADGALYAAKHGGRDRVVFQTTDLPKRNMAID